MIYFLIYICIGLFVAGYVDNNIEDVLSKTDFSMYQSNRTILMVMTILLWLPVIIWVIIDELRES